LNTVIKYNDYNSPYRSIPSVITDVNPLTIVSMTRARLSSVGEIDYMIERVANQVSDKVKIITSKGEEKS
jgi:hypothetical protein